ncbi:MAG TPA: cupin domain-containing protein [Clostridiales bacterium]|nr:cupin domain-containing protein [Clostridiales bacterium]
MNKFLKNIDYEKIVDLGGLVEYHEGQVVSRTLVQNNALSITLFSFDKGEEISTHTSKGDALVYLLDGSAKITIGDNEYSLKAGESIVMPSGIPHALKAEDCFKMLLIVVFV